MTPSATPELSVCVFGWDEVHTTEETVREIDESLSRLGVDAEIVLIDDGSTDGTSDVMDKLAEELPHARVVHHGANGGLGAIYRTAFFQSRGKVVTCFPADGQFPAEIIEDFYPRMKDHDMVLGYLPHRRISPVGIVLSKLERVIYGALFGEMPKFQGICMFRRSILDTFPLKSEGRGWAIVMELVLRTTKAGYRIVSVPTGLRPRRVGTSKVNNLKNILANTKQAVALRKLL